MGLNTNSFDFGYNPKLFDFNLPDAVGTPGSQFDLFSPSTWNSALQRNGVLGSLDAKTGLKTDGWGSMALGTASGLANLWMGMKNYGLMKDQFNFQKDSFNKNYAVQKNLTNSQLSDRQARRVLENPNATSVADYMAQYGVK